MTSLERENEDAQKLEKAMRKGDVEFLRQCVASNKPNDYYLTSLPGYGGSNMFHAAIAYEQINFIRVAIEVLPVQVIHQLLMQTRKSDGENPLHTAASFRANVEIVKMFLNVYKTSSSSSSSPSEVIPKPWLQKDNRGRTPCHLAIYQHREDCGLELLKMDIEFFSNTTHHEDGFILNQALRRSFTKIALEILRSSPSFSSSGHEFITALNSIRDHKEQDGQEICRLLLQKNPKQIEQITKIGRSELESWIYFGVSWPFKWLLQSSDIVPDMLRTLATFTSQVQFNNSRNGLHFLTATATAKNTSFPEDAVVEIAKVLINSYKLEKGTQRSGDMFPWLAEDKDGMTPLTISIIEGKQKLAMYFMSEDNNILVKSRHNNLLIAIEGECREVADMILNIVDKQGWIQLLTNNQTLNDKHLTPESSHVIRSFVSHNSGKFREYCIKYKDSPLHHIRLSSFTDYEEILNLPRMKDLTNLRNVQGVTPLHIAIRNNDILLTEALLSMEKIAYNIKDVKNETAIDLLTQICAAHEEWDEMCKRIGFDPSIKTAYFQRHTNLLDVRNTISVVAALLATITFTAGFTLPGGFDRTTGEALLAKKATFLVFLISDTLALFFSVLVLVCLIWSMVYDASKSLLLIDRSMILLMRALYCTLVAFMTGVYVVISPKSLWAAIVILIIVCTLLGISMSKTLLYKVIYKLVPDPDKEIIEPIRQLELGKFFPCVRGDSSPQEQVPLASENPIIDGVSAV